MSGDVKTGMLIPYLVEMFRFQAWTALGKIANPISGKVERNLEIAKTMVDLLGELEERTEGHRSDDESKLLQATLTDLRLNYLEEAKRPAEEAPGDEASAEGDDLDGAGDDTEDAGDDAEDAGEKKESQEADPS